MLDVVIVGAGAAGITAALYALRANLNVLITEKEVYGGQLFSASEIKNYPGIESISGPELAKKLYFQVKNIGCNFLNEEIIEANLKQKVKILKTKNRTIESKTVIIANGLKRRLLNCPGENKFKGKGVSYCATCDGPLFRGKKVAIVGGGNTAIHDALYLSKICKQLFLIVRKNDFKAEKFLVNSIKNKTNIKYIFNSKISKIYGSNQGVKGIELIDKNNIKSSISLDGVFIDIGYETNNKIFESQIITDSYGYFISDENCKTNIDGVYVAGDCRKKNLHQIVTATSDGAIAGTSAIKYILKEGL